MRVLVILDRPDTARFTLGTAGALADALGADDIRLLHPKPASDPRFKTPDEGIPTDEDRQRFAREVGTRADALRALAGEWIEAQTASARKAARNWVEIAGDIRRIVAREAAQADFVVHGRPRAHDPDAVTDAFAGALYDAQATLVVAPLRDCPTVGRKPVIAWQESEVLDRAISAARPLLDKAQRVTFVIGERGAAQTALPAFAKDLAGRGIDIAVDRFPIESGDLGEQIRAHVLAADADLLVMGAYTRPHFLEWLFGGPTQDVLANTTLPILTHH